MEVAIDELRGCNLHLTRTIFQKVQILQQMKLKS